MRCIGRLAIATEARAVGMVNWVEQLQSKLLCRLASNAGLRQLAVDVDGAGTVISLWAPAAKDGSNRTAESGKRRTCRHPVVLLHGFAGDGMMTWAFQVGALARDGRYDVYVPDLVHFGGSTSPSPDRSVAFQARCIAAALRKVGVEDPCTVVGFSYGGSVAVEMAAACPDLLRVRSVVVSGMAVVHTDTMNDALAAMLGRFGAGTLAELLLPESVGRLRSLLSAAIYMKLWFPGRLLEDFLKVMYTNRKERTELLENLLIRDGEASTPTPVFQQNILLLWGENDNFITIEDGKRLKEELGEKVTLRSIKKAGHLAHMERPCVYNRCLKEYLAAHACDELNAISRA